MAVHLAAIRSATGATVAPGPSTSGARKQANKPTCMKRATSFSAPRTTAHGCALSFAMATSCACIPRTFFAVLPTSLQAPAIGTPPCCAKPVHRPHHSPFARLHASPLKRSVPRSSATFSGSWTPPRPALLCASSISATRNLSKKSCLTKKRLDASSASMKTRSQVRLIAHSIVFLHLGVAGPGCNQLRP